MSDSDAAGNWIGWLMDFFANYFWFVLKNVIGWLLILASFVVGPFVPGPGGIPLFLIGFALITFPGKRRLTARVLHGQRIQIERGLWTIVTAALSLLAPAVMLWILHDRLGKLVRGRWDAVLLLVAATVAAIATTWLLTYALLYLLNLILRAMPRIRRMVRPWLRRRGVRLLPPRRRRRHLHGAAAEEDEIIELHDRHQARLRWMWEIGRPWLARALRYGVAMAAVVWGFKELWAWWPDWRQGWNALVWWRSILAVIILLAALTSRWWWRR